MMMNVKGEEFKKVRNSFSCTADDAIDLYS